LKKLKLVSNENPVIEGSGCEVACHTRSQIWITRLKSEESRTRGEEEAKMRRRRSEERSSRN
jgi:hypothetical protein